MACSFFVFTIVPEGLIQVQREVFAMAQTPTCSANKYFKAIIFSKTTSAKKSRDFCCVSMALALDSATVAKVKEHCFPHA